MSWSDIHNAAVLISTTERYHPSQMPLKSFFVAHARASKTAIKFSTWSPCKRNRLWSNTTPKTYQDNCWHLKVCYSIYVRFWNEYGDERNAVMNTNKSHLTSGWQIYTFCNWWMHKANHAVTNKGIIFPGRLLNWCYKMFVRWTFILVKFRFSLQASLA